MAYDNCGPVLKKHARNGEKIFVWIQGTQLSLAYSLDEVIHDGLWMPVIVKVIQIQKESSARKAIMQYCQLKTFQM